VRRSPYRCNLSLSVPTRILRGSLSDNWLIILIAALDKCSGSWRSITLPRMRFSAYISRINMIKTQKPDCELLILMQSNNRDSRFVMEKLRFHGILGRNLDKNFSLTRQLIIIKCIHNILLRRAIIELENVAASLNNVSPRFER